MKKAEAKIIIKIKKQHNDIFYSIPEDPRHYFDLASVEMHHPEMRKYLEENRSILERKMLQFREQYKVKNLFE
ncbi:MAG: hypothetical protein E7222_13040 [Clostridiales bacterium]|nr:hypothetical protein [Clostridiales bacterium]